MRFRGGLPGGLVAVALGTVLAWIIGLAPTGPLPEGGIGLFPPVLALGDLWASIARGDLVSYVSIIVPMGLFNVLGSLQNLESAEAAGDTYPTRSSLAANGLGTLAAAAFGSCFPTTIYIGHPGWKALGARAGYSTINGVFFALVGLTGSLAYIAWAVPIDAGMAIVLWIGLVITAQAFSATPREHAPAVVVGLLPGVAAWGALMAKNGLRAAGYGTPGGPGLLRRSHPRLPGVGHLDPRRLRPRAGLHLHLDDPGRDLGRGDREALPPGREPGASPPPPWPPSA